LDSSEKICFPNGGQVWPIVSAIIQDTSISQYVDSHNRQQDIPEIFFMAANISFKFRYKKKIECINNNEIHF